MLSQFSWRNQTENEEQDVLNDESFPSEAEVSSRIARETKLTISQLTSALEEVTNLNRKFSENILNNELKGLSLLQTNLEQLLSRCHDLQRWHSDKHRKVVKLGVTEEKKLFLAETSILLITPYIHRLLTTEDRRHPGGIFDFEETVLSATRAKLRELAFQNIDPVYSTRYDGICLSSLLSSIKNDINHAITCGCSSTKISYSLQAHSKVLAGKFFGAITCLEMILKLGAQDEDDLILEKAIGHTSPLEVDGIIEKSLLYDRKSAEKNLKFFTGLILTANAVIDSGYNDRYFLVRLLKYGISAARFLLPWNRAEAELRGEVCYTGTVEEINSKLLFARFIWNLPETPLVKTFYRLGLPRILVDFEFYIPPQKPGETLLEGGSDPIFARIVSNCKPKKYPVTTTIKKAMSYDWKVNTNSVSQRVLQQQSDSFYRPLLSKEKVGKDVLLIHYHGGGFIALSSFSHENYSRMWARDVPGLTILSSDYRLAPDFSFPYAFNDAYRTYRYVVETCEENLGFKPRKILLAGDSAGGNLAATVTVKAIQDNYRAPDGDAKRAEETSKDTRCSPALAHEDILRRFPPTRIVVGDCDPLMDQSVRFAHHLARLGVDVQCKIFQAMPHGFCSFIGWPIVAVPEVEKCIDQCSELLRELARNQEIDF